MVCIEAEFDGRRVMLDALPRGQRFGCADDDLAIVEYLSDSLGQTAAGMNMLSATAFLDLLPILRGHPRLSFGKAKTGPRLAGNLPAANSFFGSAGEGFEVMRPNLALTKCFSLPGRVPGSCAALTFSRSEVICLFA